MVPNRVVISTIRAAGVISYPPFTTLEAVVDGRSRKLAGSKSPHSKGHAFYVAGRPLI